jgi:phosphoribosyl 1,2-cyclic phosphodiesterase
MLSIASLNSGSNGNCYYVGNETEAVLIDVGISCKEVEKRLKRLHIPISKIKALFVTHEHADHIIGIGKLSKKYQLPVYITPRTIQFSAVTIPDELIRPLKTYDPVFIGGLIITAFPKYHDAADPHSFIVTNEKVKVGVFTDIGIACHHVIQHFKQCHAAFLESNYDVQMLATGPYPPALQNRIRNGKGHISNLQALKLVMSHKPPFMSHLILSHLSRTNNNPSIVDSMFTEIAGPTQIIVASRKKESDVFTIEAMGNEPMNQAITPIGYAQQLNLF